MTWLLIDAGNTAIKWARGDVGNRRFVGSGVQPRSDATAAAAKLASAWSQPQPSAAYGVCVADPATRAGIEAAVQAVCGRSLRWFEAQPRFEARSTAGAVALDNGYRDPTQLGADRWHALIAACVAYRGESLLVASAGTATTVDSVIADGHGGARFVGGAIAPGATLMRVSLAQGTARLPHAAGRVVGFPDNTDDAIATGVQRAQLGLIEHCAQALADELRLRALPPPRLVLAGGHGAALRAPLAARLHAAGVVAAVAVDEALVLRGVALRAHAERGTLVDGAP